MQKSLLTALGLLFTISTCLAQDLITKKNGEDVEGKVIEITDTHVKYKKKGDFEGPIYNLIKSDVLIIRYENGNKDVFNESSILNSSENENLRHQGEMDAIKYYKNYKGASTGTLIASLASPIVGLIPAVATSATEPQYKNLGFPNAELMKNTDYSFGYIKKAKKIKQRKVWTNFGIGLGVNILAGVVLYSTGYY